MRRRDVSVAVITVIVVLVLGAVFAGGYLLANNKSTLTGNKTSTTPSAAAASPSPSPSPSPAVVTLTPEHAQLQAGSGSDPSPGRGNGGPPQGVCIFVDSGWTADQCTQVQVDGPNSDGYVTYVVEHKMGSTGMQRGVFLMTTSATEAYWHTRLYAIDNTGGLYGAITVKTLDLTGDGKPELVVGFRINGPGNALAYDIVQKNATGGLTLLAHRDLGAGHAVLGTGAIEDYDQAAGIYHQAHVAYAGGTFTATPVGTVATAPAGDFP